MVASNMSGRGRRRILAWSLAAALCLVPGIMLGIVYALGPYGACEDVNTNDPTMVAVWFLATGVGAVLGYALVVVGGQRVVSRNGRRRALALLAGVVAAV